jgi:CHAT domain-containing protein/Flp pilus assembly protein TadD
MLRQVGQWLKSLWQWVAGLFAKGKPAPAPPPLAVPALSDTAYENLFMQLMDGVGEGWDGARVREHLGNRSDDSWFANWLQRFGRDKLLASPQPNHELARRMVRLGEIGCGKFGEIAGEFGKLRLAKNAEPLAEGEWEFLFGSLLERVSLGEEPVLAFLEDLQHRAILQLWVEWLRNYGERLLAADVAERDLARRMARLGEIAGGELGEVARDLGSRLLERVPVEDEVWEIIEAVFVGNGLGVAGDVNRQDAEGAEEEGGGNQEAEAWFERGVQQARAGDFEGSIASWNQALAIKPDYHEALVNRGVAQFKLGQFEQAIDSYDQALAIKPDFHQALYKRGNAQVELGQLEPAIASWNQALAIKPDYPEALSNRGLAQLKLGQFEPAIASYNQALAIKPDLPEALVNRGVAQGQLGQLEPAIASFNQALAIKPDFPEALRNRGTTQAELGQLEPAIASFNQALAIKPDLLEALFNRGAVQEKLGQFEPAIASFDAALAIKRDDWKAWASRGIAAGQSISPLQGRQNPLLAPSPLARENPELNRRGYEGKLASFKEGLKHCHRDTHPEGWGRLHWHIGDAHYFRGIGDTRHRHYWEKARNSYNTALQTLTETAFPEAHLEVLDSLMRVLRWLGEKEQADELHRHAKALLQRLLAEPKRSDWKKKQLALKFAGFHQLTVDECVRNRKPVRAWELAEEGKNACLTWLLYAWSEDIPTASWDDIQQLLNPSTAAIYWHQSPVALHTFIIKHSAPEPIVLGATPDSATETASPLSCSPSPHAEMEPGGEVLFQTRLQEFEAWVKEWNEQYQEYRNLKEKGAAGKSDKKSHPWYAGMEKRLQRLGEILDIPAILEQVAGIPQLILIPHRDLHPLPLEYLFPDRLTLTRLPSAQIGKMLSAAPAFPSPPNPLSHKGRGGEISSAPANPSRANPEKIILSAETPDSKGFPDLPLADVESAAIAQMFPPTGITRISGTQVTNTTLKECLQQPHRIFHFTGHGVANISNPAFSYLPLTGEDKLTVKDILSINLDGYELISLSACETALTRNQTITAEYVGLVSGFLRAGAAGALTTLWVVQSNASALMTIQFYRQRKKGRSQAVARANAVKWLKQLTPKKLSRLYKAALAKLPLYEDTVRPTVETELTTLAQQEEQDGKLFQHPYYWAAFTIAGTFQ